MNTSVTWEQGLDRLRDCLLRGKRTKRWVRTFYALTSLRKLKKSALSDRGATEYWQAGKSVGGIHEVRPVRDIMREFEASLAAPA